MLKNENNAQEDIFIDDIKMPTTLLEEFLKPLGEKDLLEGLQIMFESYFKQNRYFDNRKFESVLKTYHFCNHFLSNKQLFNPQNVA